MRGDDLGAILTSVEDVLILISKIIGCHPSKHDVHGLDEIRLSDDFILICKIDRPDLANLKPQSNRVGHNTTLPVTYRRRSFANQTPTTSNMLREFPATVGK